MGAGSTQKLVEIQNKHILFYFQRQLRLSDAKVVEAKAARIKDWVTNKLRELEEQNAHLKAQNAKASDQMELLRNRLEQLQAFNATTAATTAATISSSSKNGKGRSDSMAEVGKTK